MKEKLVSMYGRLGVMVKGSESKLVLRGLMVRKKVRGMGVVRVMDWYLESDCFLTLERVMIALKTVGVDQVKLALQ